MIRNPLCSVLSAPGIEEKAIAPEIGTACQDTTSPALAYTKSEGAYELKFLLSDKQADEILIRARQHLTADPHAGGKLGDSYSVTSLYFDTANFAVYFGERTYGRRKFRIRRYGDEQVVFLERKSKSRGFVKKRRSMIPERELAFLNSLAPSESWSGFWFHQRLVRLLLQPKCQVTYERVARVGNSGDGPIRLTVDRHLRCRPMTDATCSSFKDGIQILAGQSIVELKFRGVLPQIFKTWIHEMQLVTTPASKYRRCVDACSLWRGLRQAEEETARLHHFARSQNSPKLSC